MAQDKRSDWGVSPKHFKNTDPEYHRLVTDLRRQEEGQWTAEQYWDEVMPDTHRPMGEELAAASLVAVTMATAFRGGKVGRMTS